MNLETHKDFLCNKDYLLDLAERIDSENAEYNEIVQAHYYVNRLLKESNDDSLSVQLRDLSTIYESVLDTIDNKSLLEENKQEQESEEIPSGGYIKYAVNLFIFTLLLIVVLGTDFTTDLVGFICDILLSFIDFIFEELRSIGG